MGCSLWGNYENTFPRESETNLITRETTNSGEMSLIEKMLKMSTSKILVAVLTISISIVRSGIAQDNELMKYLPADPEVLVKMDIGKLESMVQGLGVPIPGGDAASGLIKSLLGENAPAMSNGVLALYDLGDLVNSIDLQAMAQDPSQLSDLKFIFIETYSDDIDSGQIEDAASQFEQREHSSSNYFYWGEGSEFANSVGGQGAFFMPNPRTAIAGNEELLKSVIDRGDNSTFSDGNNLMDLFSSDLALSAIFRIPDGALQKALDESDVPALMKPMLVGFTEVQNAMLGLDTSSGAIGIRTKLQFPTEDVSTLEQQLTALMAGMGGGEGGPANPAAGLMQALQISSEGNTISIDMDLPKEMLSMIAGGGPGGPGGGFPGGPPSAADVKGLPSQIKLVNMTVIKGEIIDFWDSGVVVKQEGGNFSERIHWSEMHLDTLVEFNKIGPTRTFVQDYIPRDRPGIKELSLVEHNPATRPKSEKGFMSSLFLTPIGIGFLALIYLGNIWAAMEVAAFRSHPMALVAGSSAIMPIIAPLIFYFIPTQTEYAEEYVSEDDFEEVEADEASEPAASPEQTAKGTGAPKGFVMPEPEGGGLSLSGGSSKPSKSSSELQPGQRRVYKRGEVEISRSFIEKNFVPFFRTVVSGPEANQLIDFKTPKATVTAKRISRISPNEVYVQLQSGGPNEKGVKIAEIAEIVVRHKNDRG